MQCWPSSQVDFRGLFDNGDLLLWSGVQRAYPQPVHFLTKTRMVLPLICSIFFLSLWSWFSFSLISSQQHIPPSSLCLPFLQEISLTTVLFFHFMTWLLGLYYCVRVFLVLVVTLPPSFSLRPYINTGSDFSLLVYNMFLQLYQERCVNGREACWVAGLVF